MPDASIPTDKQELIAAVNAIPAARWEESLPIGVFRELRVTKTIAARNSRIAVCRIEGDGGGDTAYVKLMHGIDTVERRNIADDARNEFETLRFWSEKFAGSDRYHTIQPLFVLPEQRIIATREAKGAVLADLLANGRLFPTRAMRDRLAAAFKNVGGWLRHFQAIPTDQDVSGNFSIRNMMDYLDQRLMILTEEKARRFPQQYRDRIMKHLDRHKNSVPPKGLKLALTHGDFNLSNLLIHGSEVTAFDFGRVIPDSFLLDVARAYHQLYLFTLKPWNRRAVFSQLQQALLDGFGQPTADRQLIFRLTLIRHTITHLVTVTQFYQQPKIEQVYNLWVLAHELRLLDRLLEA